MEKQVTINGQQRTIQVNTLTIVDMIRTGVSATETSLNYSFVCSADAGCETEEDLLSDLGALSMFNNDVRVPVTDARPRRVKSLQAIAPKVDETNEALLKVWDDKLKSIFVGKDIAVKMLTVSVKELTNGEHDSYTLKFGNTVVENVTARTTAYIDDDTKAYERLRKQVLADIANEEAGE